MASSGSRFAPRRLAGAMLRRVGTAAVGARLDALEAAMGDLQRGLTRLDELLTRDALDVDAIRQQVDECRDFLEVQHDVVRDALHLTVSVPDSLSSDTDRA